MKRSNIPWTDYSLGGPVIGCPGCELDDHCYAMFDNPARVLRAGGWPGYKGQKIETFGPGSVRVPVKGFEAKMLAIQRRPWICDQCGAAHKTAMSCRNCGYAPIHRARIFVNSNSDICDPVLTVETRAHFWDVIRRCPDVDVQVLTKQPQRFIETMESVIRTGGAVGDFCNRWLCASPPIDPPQNIWFGTSIVDQRTADLRIPELLKIPAAVRFLSVEPMISEIDLSAYLPHYPDGRCKHVKLDFVIIGAESGRNARPCEHDWIRSIRDQCRAVGVKLFVKQMVVNGRLTDKLADFPADLQIRQWPEVTR